MATYSVTIPNIEAIQQAWKQAPTIVRGQVVEAINKSLVTLQADAKRNAPIQTGHLRSSIQITPAVDAGDVIGGKVYTDNVRYALWVEEGTGIYGRYGTPIVPVKAKALRFMIGGQVLYRKSVAGMRGRFYMKNALESNTTTINSFFQQALTNALTAIGGAS